jgi:hypothetical protein
MAPVLSFEINSELEDTSILSYRNKVTYIIDKNRETTNII